MAAILCFFATIGLALGVAISQPLLIASTKGGGREAVFSPKKFPQWACFRIPALLAVPAVNESAGAGLSTRTRLLAFAEGRQNDCYDSGAIDMVLRISNDGGDTWGPLSVIATGSSAGFTEAATMGNAAPVYDARTDRIVLVFCANRAADTEVDIIATVARGSRYVYVMHSDDRGESWSKPRNITARVKPPDWTWYATGPGAGVQLRSGRLLVACNHVQTLGVGAVLYASHVLFSDNGGLGWQLGGSAGIFTNEAAVAELPNADVLVLNMRQVSRAGLRVVAISRDAGRSWERVQLDYELPEPGCQGHLLGLPAGLFAPLAAGGLFFSNPNSPLYREHLTVKFRPSLGSNRSASASDADEPSGGLRAARGGPPRAGLAAAEARDGGSVPDAQWGGRGGWTSEVLVYPGKAAYSAMALIGAQRLGVLYENGKGEPTERISMASYSLSHFRGLSADAAP